MSPLKPPIASWVRNCTHVTTPTRLHSTSLVNFIQGSDVVQRFFGNLAFVGRVQIKEFPTRMRHAVDLGDAQFKACLVASEVIADQLALPVSKEVSGMFASAARAEVVNDRHQIGEYLQ